MADENRLLFRILTAPRKRSTPWRLITADGQA
jgi:hypothetical protein